MCWALYVSLYVCRLYLMSIRSWFNAMKYFFPTLSDMKCRLQMTRGSFCSMWHVSCALILRSEIISTMNFWYALMILSCWLASKKILDSILTQLLDIFSNLEVYLVMYLRIRSHEVIGWQSMFTPQYREHMWVMDVNPMIISCRFI